MAQNIVPYKKWWYIVNIIHIKKYDVVHEFFYGEDLKEWITNVEITCSSKNCTLFLTPYIKEC